MIARAEVEPGLPAGGSPVGGCRGCDATSREGGGLDWPGFPVFDHEEELPPWVFGGPRPSWDKRDWLDVVDPTLPPPPFQGPRPAPEIHESIADCPTWATHLAPPPFGEVAADTQQCFSDLFGPGLEDWPATECAAPCLLPVEDCGLPSEAEGLAATWVVPLVPISQVFLDTLPDTDKGADDSGIDPTPEQLAFARSAIALLLANLDLVEWALCLAGSWSVDEPPEENEEADTTALVDCVLALVSGGMSVYLVWSFNELGNGATGGATKRYSWTPDGRTGPVIPLDADKWQAGVVAHAAGTLDGLCAAITLAGVLLHEVVHLCEPDTGPDCNPDGPAICCSEEQRMTQSTFQWAMSQRYSCLAVPTASCKLGLGSQFAASADFVGYVG